MGSIKKFIGSFPSKEIGPKLRAGFPPVQKPQFGPGPETVIPNGPQPRPEPPPIPPVTPEDEPPPALTPPPEEKPVGDDDKPSPQPTEEKPAEESAKPERKRVRK